MAWIPMIDMSAADGELLETYRALMSRPLPSAYRPPHGGAPGIIRAHSMDPGLMKVVFGATGANHRGESLTWGDRELLSAVTARMGQCLY